MTQKSQISVVPAILLLALMAGCTLAAAVDFTVSETAGLRRFGYPVSASLELPAGACAHTADARLLDAAGKSLPAQFTAMSHWQDGSVRGLDVDFVLSLAPMETRSFRVDAGTGPQPALPKGLSVVETPDEIIVASSAISHRIRRDGNPLLTSIRNGNQEFLAAGGITTTLAAGPVKVIKQGPFNVTLQLGEIRLEYVSSKSWVKITQRADAPADLAVDAHFALSPLPLLWDFGAGSWLYGNLKKPGESALLRQGAANWQVFTGEGSEPSLLYATGKSCQGWGHLANRERVVAFGMGNYNTEGEPSFHLSADGRLRAAARRKELTVYFHVVGQPVHVTAVTSPPSMLSPLSVRVAGAVRAGQAEVQGISERVLVNLCSGPPADPLPPL
jgi:hypothetical protein